MPKKYILLTSRLELLMAILNGLWMYYPFILPYNLFITLLKTVLMVDVFSFVITML